MTYGPLLPLEYLRYDGSARASVCALTPPPRLIQMDENICTELRARVFDDGLRYFIIISRNGFFALPAATRRIARASVPSEIIYSTDFRGVRARFRTKPDTAYR